MRCILELNYILCLCICITYVFAFFRHFQPFLRASLNQNLQTRAKPARSLCHYLMMRKKRWKYCFTHLPKTVLGYVWFGCGYLMMRWFFTLQDLFASAVKSNPKSNQAKASTPQSTRAVSHSLFSDDEVQNAICNISLLQTNILWNVQYVALLLWISK